MIDSESLKKNLEDRGLLHILDGIAARQGLLTAEILEPGRGFAGVVSARQEFWHYLQVEKGWSATQIADLFGRDYQNIRSGIKRYLARTEPAAKSAA